ncbi:predicted protein [Streptomyces sp. AA4]|nr:predicted protein [Streptomyces sp. AA4]
MPDVVALGVAGFGCGFACAGPAGWAGLSAADVGRGWGPGAVGLFCGADGRGVAAPGAVGVPDVVVLGRRGFGCGFACAGQAGWAGLGAADAGRVPGAAAGRIEVGRLWNRRFRALPRWPGHRKFGWGGVTWSCGHRAKLGCRTAG